MNSLRSTLSHFERYHRHLATFFLSLAVASFVGYGSFREAIIARATNITISGVLYDDNPAPWDCSSYNVPIYVKVNGAGSYSTTCTAADGSFSIPTVNVSANDIITIFTDDPDAAAVTVVRAPAVPANQAIDLYFFDNRIEQRGVGAITNTDLGLYDGDQNANIGFTVTGNDINGSIHVLNNTTYTAGGNFTNGGLTVESGSVVTLDGTNNSLLSVLNTSGTIHIAGTTSISGTFANSGGTINYLNTPTVTITGTVTGAITLYDVVFSGTNVFQVGAQITVDHDVSIASGALLRLAGTMTVTGNLTTTGTGMIEPFDSTTVSTVTVNGSTLGGGTGHLIFYNLQKNAAGTTTWSSNASLNFVKNQLTVSAGTLVLPSELTVKTISDAGGTINPNSGTVHLLQTSNSTVSIANTLHNLSLTDGLLAHYAFDETSIGSVADSSGFGLNGTAVGSPTSDTSVPTTQFTNGRSIGLNGSSQYVDFGNPDLLNTNFGDTISMSAWVKPATVIGFHTIVGKSYTSPHADPYYAWTLMQISAVISCRIGSTLVQSSGVGSGALSSGSWQHVACVYNGATVKVYLNGVEVASSPLTGAVPTSDRNVRVGARDTADMGEYFNGSIDDVRIYNRAVSAADIQALAEGTQWGLSGATATLGAPLSVSGTLSIPSGTFDVSGTNYGVSVGGSIDFVGGIFVPRSGTITLTGTGAGNTIHTGRQRLNALTLNGSGGTYTLQDRIDMNGALTVQAGTLDVSASNYPLRAATINQTGGTIQARSGTITLTSSTDAAAAITSSLSQLRIEDTTEQHLFGYWKLDEGVGTTILDASGQGNTGTVTNGYSWTSSLNSSTPYDNPRAIDLDGVNDYVTIGNVLNVSSTADFSIAGWINRDTSTTDDVILAKRNGTSASDIGYLVWIDAATDKVRMEVSDGTNEYELASSGTIATTGWHHIAITWDENLIAGTKLYIDGILDAATATGTLSSVGTLLNSVDLRIGSESDNGAPFDGKIDDLRFYGTPLSATQIANLAAGRYAQGTSGTSTVTLSGTPTIATLAIDSGMLNSGTAVLTVSNSFTLADGNGGYAGGSGSQTFSSGITITGASFATGGTTICTGNYSQTGGSFVGSNGGTLSISGNLEFGTNASVTGGTSTIQMTGSNVTIDDNDKVVGNLTISQTATTINSGLYIGGQFNIANGATFTLASSRTARVLNGGTLSLNSTGTITGAGTFIYQSSAPFPTGGTISSLIRIDATNTDQSLSARTYGGAVEFYSSSATSRMIYLGTAASQTLAFSSTVTMTAAGDGDVTVDGTLYSPQVNITGDVTMSGSGQGSELLAYGDGIWTLSGNLTLNQGFAAPHIASIYPSWDNYGSSVSTYQDDGQGGCTLQSEVLSCGTASSSTMFTGDEILSNGGQACDVGSQTDSYFRTYFTYDISSISASARVTGVQQQVNVTAAGSAPTIGRAGNDVLQATACDALYNVGSASAYNTFTDWGTGNRIVYLPIADMQSQLGSSAYSLILYSGQKNTITASDSATNKPVLRVGYALPATSPTVVMNGAGVTLTANSYQPANFYNLTLSGSVTIQAASTVYIGHDFTISGTVTNNTAALVMIGSGTVAGHGNTIGNLSIFPAASVIADTDLTLSTNLVVYAGATLSIATGSVVTSTATITNNGTITGSGTLSMTHTSTGPGTTGTISVPVRFDATSGNISSTIFDARTYGSSIELYSSSGSARTVTMAAATYTTSGASSHLYLTAAGAGNITLDAQTNNATVTLGGGIDFLGSGGGTERITPGTNTWTVGGSIDFTNGVFLAPTNHTLVLNGGSSSITFANQAPYNLTIASSAGITAQDSITVGHTLNVASSGTLTLGSGAVMTLGSPVTLQGTIIGAGTLYLDSVATIGTTGTLASNVTFDAVGGDITIPTRTFSGVGRTVRLIADTAPYTLGDSAGTLTIAGNLIIDDGGAEVVVDARPYNIAVSIGGSFTLAPSATPDIYFGTGTWTIGGNVDISNAFIASAATSTIDMTGSGVTMAWTSETIGTVMIHGSVTSTTGLTVATLLSVETGADFTFPNATTTIQGNFSNTGTIHGGSGTVAFTAGSTGKTIVCGSGSFTTVVFNNAAGGWTMQNSNCSVDGNFSLTAASAFTLQSGRTLTIAGTFTNSVGGSATTWSGSTLSLQGSGTNTIQSKAVTDAYGAIVIGSQRSVRTWNTTSTSVTVTSGGGFTSYDDQGSDGRLYIHGTVHVPNGEAWSYDTDFDGALLGTARAVTVVVEPSSSVVVDAGDTLTIAGEEFSQHRTSVDRNGASGTFSMTIQGHLDAQYFDLHHLSSAGLTVGATGVVDRLSYGIFDDGVSGGSYITLSNPASTLTTTSLVFDSIGNGVDAATPNSITASGSGVNWTMNGAAGQRTGSATDVVGSGASITWNIPTLSVLDGDTTDIDVGAYTDHLAAHWTPSDTTYISTFTIQLGTSAGAADAYSATDVGPVLSTEITGLSLTNGQTYYVTIRGLNVLNDVVVSATSDGVLLDGAAPELTDLSVTADTTTASVAWTTDEAATSVVFFGTTSDLGTTVVNSTSLTTTHTASLSNLTAGTQYFVQVQSADAAGNTVTSELISFTTTSTSSTVTAVPALYAPVYRRSGSRTTIIVTGIARESASVRLYVDGKLTATHTITRTSTVTSFAIPFSTAKLANGKHSYYVRAVNADGVVSAKSKTVRFTVSGSSVSKRVGLSVVSKYVVQQGDSLWSIARRFLGDGSRYQELIISNKDSVPSIVQRASRILIGWVLRIPIF